MEHNYPDIPGAIDLFAWFGYWPVFHDSEVLSLQLEREGPSLIRIHTWERTPDVDALGYYVNRKHVVVTLVIEDISDLELSDFSHQNVLGQLLLTKNRNGYKLEMRPCYGIGGSITARSIRIEFERCEWPESIGQIG